MYHFRKLRMREIQSGRPSNQEAGMILGRQFERRKESTRKMTAMLKSQHGSNVLDLTACRQKAKSVERAEVFEPHLGAATPLLPPVNSQSLRRHASRKGQRVHMVKRPARLLFPVVYLVQPTFHSLSSQLLL